MKKMTTLLVAVLWTGLAFAADNGSKDVVETQEPSVKEAVEQGLCSYVGTNKAELGESAVAELAEAGHTVVAFVAEQMVACTVETAADLAYKGVLKPVGSIGAAGMTFIGNAITSFIEALTGAEYQGSPAQNDRPDL